MSASGQPMLETEGLEVAYGSVVALRGVSLTVGRGEVVAMIGANGAGKTTFLRTICGLVKPRAGHIMIDGVRCDAARSHEIIARGVAMVPEGRRIFPYMNVLDNLRLGAYQRRDRSAIRDDLETILERFPRLRERAGQLAGRLSGGEQQMVALGRALMSRPRLLLLDEPSLGLAPRLVQQVADAIRSIFSDQGVTILLVEQNARMALELSHRAFVLDNGRVALAGPASQLRENDHVRALYLGG